MAGDALGNTAAANRRALAGKLAFAVGFLLILACVSFWTIRTFVFPPSKTIVLPPDALAEARVTPGVRAAVPLPAASNGRPTFSGRVLDARTHQPIAKFQLRLGYGYAGQNNNALYFNAQPVQNFTGGRYRVTTRFGGGTNMLWYLRIEAHGYLPSVSPPLRASGMHEFDLIPGDDIHGLVLDAAGKPVAGAAVVLAIPGLPANIDPTMRANTPRPGAIQAITNSQGQFDLPPQIGMVEVAAQSTEGFAQIKQDASAGNWTVHLAPWGRIGGQLMIAGKTGAHRRILVQSEDWAVGTDPNIYKSSTADTDADGHYHLDRFPPGRVQISRIFMEKSGQYSMQMSTQTEEATLAPGQTLTVNLGGKGRPVTGRVILPAGAGSLQSYFVQSQVNGMTAPEPPPQMPANVRNSSPAAQSIWMQFFSMTPVGREYLRTHPLATPTNKQYAMEFGANGTFRIEDVVPGNYWIWIYAYRPQGGRMISLPTQANFTMPPVPEGYSDQPLVIPDLKMKLQ